MGKKKNASKAAAAGAVQPDTVNSQSILSIEGSGAGDNKAAAETDVASFTTPLAQESNAGSGADAEDSNAVCQEDDRCQEVGEEDVQHGSRAASGSLDGASEGAESARGGNDILISPALVRASAYMSVCICMDVWIGSCVGPCASLC